MRAGCTSARGEVIAVGGANIDIKAKAAGDLAPGTSNPGEVSFTPGGVARNIAHNLAKLEVPVALISAIGTDAFSRDLLKHTETQGVDCSMVLRTEGPASSYVAILDAGGEMAVAVNAMPAMELLTPEYLALYEDRLAAARLIVADCNLPEASLVWLTRFSEKLIVEPVSVAKAEKLGAIAGREIFAVTCNRRQAEHLTRLKIADIGDGLSAAVALHERGFVNVVITLGPHGATASQKGKAPAHIAPVAKIARDVTGGGDAAAAGLIFGWTEDLDLIAAAGLGQAAAALAVAEIGSASSQMSRARLLSLRRSPTNAR